MQRRSDHDHLSLEKPWQPSLAYGRKDTANLVIYVKFPTLHVPHATKNVFIKLTMLLRTSPLLLLPPTLFSLEEKASASMFWAHLTLILICQKDVCVWYSLHTMRSSSSLDIYSKVVLEIATMLRTANFPWHIIIFLLKVNAQLIRPFRMCCSSYSSTIKSKSCKRDGYKLQFINICRGCIL